MELKKSTTKTQITTICIINGYCNKILIQKSHARELDKRWKDISTFRVFLFRFYINPTKAITFQPNNKNSLGTNKSSLISQKELTNPLIILRLPLLAVCNFANCNLHISTFSLTLHLLNIQICHFQCCQVF